MNHKNSWIIELAKEILWDIVFVLVVCLILTNAFSIFDSLIISVLLRFILKLFARMVLLRLPKSKLYRLPQVACKGVIHTKHAGNFQFDHLHREWILFNTSDQQIEVYSASQGGPLLVEGTIFYCNAKTTLREWDAGTLYYRKGKKYNYFEHFVKGVCISDD